MSAGRTRRSRSGFVFAHCTPWPIWSCSVLLKGANFHPDPVADDPSKVFASLSSPPTHLIVQNEVPLETTKAFLAYAHAVDEQRPCMTVFNPSPMLSKAQLQNFNWKDVDVLIVNEGEGKDLLDAMGSKAETDVLQGLDSLQQLHHTSWIVMTRGGKGVAARVRQDGKDASRSHFDVPPAKPRQVRDTTGAGDTFAGNLVASLMRQSASQQASSPLDVLQWAAMAAAVAVETDGAMESIPRYDEVAKRQKELLG